MAYEITYNNTHMTCVNLTGVGYTLVNAPTFRRKGMHLLIKGEIAEEIAANKAKAKEIYQNLQKKYNEYWETLAEIRNNR